VELDGRESVVRNRSDGLTDLIAASMQAAAPGADAAVFNAGSIRIDDVLPPGPLTEYDVIRILPFGGEVTEVEMAGGLLRKVLDQGVANAGSGGLLHYAGIDRDQAGGWRVGGAPLDPAKTYRVALTDFLLTGRLAGCRASRVCLRASSSRQGWRCPRASLPCRSRSRLGARNPSLRRRGLA
jgi:5'-nucleotidase